MRPTTTSRKAKKRKSKASAKQKQARVADALLREKIAKSVADAAAAKPGATLREEHYKFLLQAGQLLSSSLDYEKTLQRVADLAVTRLAEWCTVHIVGEDGAILQLALAHADPKMVQYAKELNQKYPSNYDRLRAPGGMLETGKPELVSEITDAMLIQGARDEEHLRIIRSLHFSSYMAIPMITRGRTLGIISFFASHHRHYTQKDVEFAELLAVRAAFAVDNARLYREAQHAIEQVQELNKALEEKVLQRTEELRDAQRKDRANLRRMRFMIRHLPLAAIALSEDNIVLEVNDLFCHMFGFTSHPDDIIGREGQIFMEQWNRVVADPESHMREMKEAADALRPLMNQEIPLKDGRILLREYVPIVEQGKCYGHIITYRDITKERRIDATKSEFMSLASHQLRTPLTAIRWIFGRLGKNLAGTIGIFEQQLLEDGRNAAARMSETITTMLEISRIQAGQVEIRRRPFLLLQFLRDLVYSSSDAIAAKQQDVTVICDDGLQLISDEQLLQELMSNLFSNALKYTPEKGSICLSALRQAHTIQLTVQDSGYGIPQHQQAKVFRKFFRGDNILSKDPNGTGLGLHMVSLIAELLGGDIDFESEQGRGTTFRLTLPAS